LGISRGERGEEKKEWRKDRAKEIG